MPRGKRKVKRKMKGGYLPRSIGENNLNALNNIAVGENNLNAIKLLELPKPPLQPTGQIVNVAAMPYQVTGNVPLFDRIRGALKRSQVISKTARKLGATRLANFAESHGYGRKPRRRIRGRGPAFVDRYGTYIRAY